MQGRSKLDLIPLLCVVFSTGLAAWALFGSVTTEAMSTRAETFRRDAEPSVGPMKVNPAREVNPPREVNPARAIAMVNAFSHSSLASKPSYPGPGAWLRGGSSALMHRIQGDADGNLFEHDFRVCDAYAGGIEAARRVACPAHLIVGSRDAMTPAKATKELAGMLNAAVSRIDSGHALMQEAPDAVLNAMRQAIEA